MSLCHLFDKDLIKNQMRTLRTTLFHFQFSALVCHFIFFLNAVMDTVGFASYMQSWTHISFMAQ